MPQIPASKPRTVSIRKNALLSALQGSKNMHPDEFIALFRGQDDDAAPGGLLLTELVIPPLAQGDEDSSSYNPYFIPANSREKASFHSHPDPDTAYPSDEDLFYMARSGGVHFIACYPFRLQDVACFDADGRPMRFQIV